MDTTKWVAIDRPDEVGGEVAYYKPYNVSVSNGSGVFKTQRDSSQPSAAYTSGSVMWKSFSYLYGTIEYRAKFPGGNTWPAVWLLGKNCQAETPHSADNVNGCDWPNVGSDEIDISEMPGWPGSTNDNLHINQQIHATDASGNNHGDECMASTTDVSQNWHVYQLVWQPGSLVWKIDGITTCTINAKYVPATPMFLIINTGVGSNEQVSNSTMPQTMLIDYVKVTQ